jgi:hypothetical protein
MRSRQIFHELEQGKQQGKDFIKWWRKENDFADFELIDRYMKMADQSEIENFELLDKDEMWEVLTYWKSSGLRRSKSTKGEKIEWQHMGKDGLQHTYTCPYTARAIMSIFDAETHGDTLV